MSKLFCTESGRVMMGENEEITRWRWARKEMKLPGAAARADADLWMMVCEYKDNREPLVVEVNGRAAGKVKPNRKLQRIWHWEKVAVPRRLLKAGVNRIVVKANNPSMTAWVLAVESGYRDPGSQVSNDQGRTWTSDHMGARCALRGEYLIRLRSQAAGLRDDVPAIVYEDAKHPRVKATLDLLPAAIKKMKDPWKQALLLRTWVAKRFVYSSGGSNYAPFDPGTIFKWAEDDWGHGRGSRVTMCVHYGATFTALAGALGLKARCCAISANINSFGGHFVAEAWDPGRGKWVMHDANCDVHYEDGGEPLSLVDIADRVHEGKSLAPWAKLGAGFPHHSERLVTAFKESFATGKAYRLAGVWTRNDYLSDPAASPPAHGSVIYCETPILWYVPSVKAVKAEETEMFPGRTGDRGVFEAGPG